MTGVGLHSASAEAGIEPRDLASADLATPALVLDRRRLEANIAAMAKRARDAGVALWPHAKTHKSTEIAALQLRAGAEGITVATIAEAETMVAAGLHDILLAYPPVDRWRIRRIVALAARAQITVTLDDLETARALDAACAQAGVCVRYLWEVDCGTGRCGTRPGAETADLVAAAVDATAAARFAGLMTFAGHAYASKDEAELAQIARDEVAAVGQTAVLLERRGVACPVLSVGTTPTVHHLPAEAAGMQIRPGNYVFNDATQVALGVCGAERCALTVLSSVIARPSSDRAILDAGSKALSSDRMTSRTAGFGFVAELPQLRIERLYEEHAIAHGVGALELEVGSRVRIIPNHACVAANLHSSVLVIEEETVVEEWSIAARGWT